MSKKNSLIAVTLILALLLTIGIFGRGLLRQQELNDSSQDFAVAATLHILSDEPAVEQTIPDPELSPSGNNPEILRDYAHPALAQQEELLSDYIDALYFINRFLGRLEVIQSISGGSDVSLLATGEQNPSAEYALDARFSGGPATIRIAVMWHEDRWSISEFLVESDQLSD